MKKYSLIIYGAIAVGIYFLWKAYGHKAPNSGATKSTTGTANAAPVVNKPYNAASTQAKQDRSTASQVNDYLGAAGTLISGVKSWFGGSSGSTGTSSPATSGGGTASPIVYDSQYQANADYSDKLANASERDIANSAEFQASDFTASPDYSNDPYGFGG